MKQQILIIHGGEAFATYDDYIAYLESCTIDPYEVRPKGWKDNFAEDIGDAYEVIRPTMPSKMNAKYREWKIWFLKYLPHVRDGVVLVGHSLGGIFLAKFLSEEKLSVQCAATILVAAPFDASDELASLGYSLADFVLQKSFSRMEEQGGVVYLIHSTDDPVVPYADVEKYKALLPHAALVPFKDKGHFIDEHFPELVTIIKKLTTAA